MILFLLFRFTYEEFNEAHFANPGRCHTIFCFKDPNWDEYVKLTYGTYWGAYAKTTATAAKTSLENKHLGNGDYFQIIASSSHPILLKEHAAKGQVEAPLKVILRMKDLLLCVHVVVKTLNLEISRCHLADYVKEL